MSTQDAEADEPDEPFPAKRGRQEYDEDAEDPPTKRRHMLTSNPLTTNRTSQARYSTNRNKSKQAKAIKSVPFTHHEQLQRLEKPFFIEEIPHLTNLLPEDIRDL
ncbi:hypothetical protein PG999_007501 [Apiospora kogelbergensis]|uniref:Uncharacterized protein n=1 Tax=Apiospora kogelbergensis TaxID=1337665 RepID=A0AAW0QYI1_9PEZI